MAYKKIGDRLLKRAWNDRRRAPAFHLGEGRLETKKTCFYYEGGGTLAQVSQRGGECHIPGNIQVGQDSKQPAPVKDVPAHWWGLGLDNL